MFKVYKESIIVCHRDTTLIRSLTKIYPFEEINFLLINSV